MFLDQLSQLTEDDFLSIEWQGDSVAYDRQIYDLACESHRKCLVKNFHNHQHLKFLYLVDSLPDQTDQCVVWKYKGEWIGKLFYQGWTSDQGYLEIDLPVAQITWRKNPDIDFSMTFYDSPLGIFEPDPWDLPYNMIWYMDPDFNPTDDKIWVMSCEVLGNSSGQTKDMGYLTPNVTLEINPKLPSFDIDLATLVPPYWNLDHDCVYYLDFPNQIEPIWVAKISPNYRKTKGWLNLGNISVEPNIIYNFGFENLEFDLDLNLFTIGDMRYECCFYLDKKHLSDDQENQWAFKVLFTAEPEGVKIKGYISPKIFWENNPDLAQYEIDLSFQDDYCPKIENFNNRMIWYTDPGELTNYEKIWVSRARLVDNTDKDVESGIIYLNSGNFDVFFISYDEPLAEENFQRLQRIVPYARRIHGVKGILEAHRAAALESKTEMFFVVDGDSHVLESFDFKFKPGIFDFDTVFVWKSQNPYHDINYGYGGIKLFPTKKVISMTEWNLDMTLSVSDKLKVIDQIGNITKIDSSPYHAYRSAFRECAKLASIADKQSKERLQAWLNLNTKINFSEYALKGAKDGVSHFLFSNDMLLINDYDYLDQKFKEAYGR